MFWDEKKSKKKVVFTKQPNMECNDILPGVGILIEKEFNIAWIPVTKWWWRWQSDSLGSGPLLVGEIDFQKGADWGDLNRLGGTTILELTLCNAFHHFVIITIATFRIIIKILHWARRTIKPSWGAEGCLIATSPTLLTGFHTRMERSGVTLQ